MSQGKALRIPDREKPARRIPCETERKGLNPGKVETRQSRAGKGARGRHSEERKGAQVPEGRAGRRPGSPGIPDLRLHLAQRFSLRCLRWLGLVFLMSLIFHSLKLLNKTKATSLLCVLVSPFQRHPSLGLHIRDLPSSCEGVLTP